MKVGIITKIGKNYGALLQAYALKTACNKLHAEAHIIKYTPDISVKSYSVCPHKWRFRGTIINLKSIIHYSEYKRSSNRFLKFREEYFDFIGNYRTYDELANTLPQFDIYISGSDQIWNPEIAFDKAFYYPFVEKNKSVVASYAASIGLKEIPKSIYEEFKKRVQHFDFVSVREEQAKVILDEMGIQSIVAPDPTILLEKDVWDELAILPETDKYILCYFVSFPKGIEKVIRQVQECFGKEYKVINLMTTEDSARIGDIQIRDAGPKEFLGLFKNAEFVITSSFHGTVFSVLNKKRFLTTLYKSTGSRVVELLSKLGLEDRIISPDDENVFSLIRKEDIYCSSVDKKLQEYRAHGLNVLERIINNKEE